MEHLTPISFLWGVVGMAILFLYRLKNVKKTNQPITFAYWWVDNRLDVALGFLGMVIGLAMPDVFLSVASLQPDGENFYQTIWPIMAGSSGQAIVSMVLGFRKDNKSDGTGV